MTNDLEKHTRDYAEESVNKIASRLRGIADRLERDAPRMQTDSYMSGLSNVIHEIVWGTANLGLDSLISRVHDITTAREAVLAELAIEGSPVQVGDEVLYEDKNGVSRLAIVGKVRIEDGVIYALLTVGTDVVRLPVKDLRKEDTK